MKDLSAIYKKSFFSRRSSLNWRAPIMAEAIRDIFDPQFVLDIGCATGDIIKALHDLNIWAYGIEGSTQVLNHLEVNTEYIIFQDLRVPFRSWRPFEMDYNVDVKLKKSEVISCLEVAEHIEEDYAGTFMDNITMWEKDYILFTAAPPGQGGHYHVNCQPPGYWIDHFYGRRYHYKPIMTETFKSYIFKWKHKKGIKAYYDNVMIFERRKHD